MEEQVDRLVQKTWEKYQTLSPSQRLLIAIAGIPGSGKTTLASTVTTHLNALHARINPGTSPSLPPAAHLPMDGYHLTRAQLSSFPDAATAHARRGAPFTFDGPSFLALIKRLRAPLCPETQTIHAPSFSHAIKDPVENDIPIAPTHRIVLVEGNYVALDEGPWREAAEMMDEVWFVEVDLGVARARLVKRHVEAGICRDEDEAGRRADENDLVNGREVLERRVRVDEVVRSVEDGEWVEEEVEKE